MLVALRAEVARKRAMDAGRPEDQLERPSPADLRPVIDAIVLGPDRAKLPRPHKADQAKKSKRKQGKRKSGSTSLGR